MFALTLAVGSFLTFTFARRTHAIIGACVALYYASALWVIWQHDPILELMTQHSLYWVTAFLMLALYAKEEVIGAGALLAAIATLHNPSMAGCFLVCLLPQLPGGKTDTAFVWAVLPLGLLLTGASLPLGLYAFALLLQLRPRYWLWLLPVGLVGGGLALALQPLGVWLSGSGRFEVWANAFTYWPIRGLLGSGPGTAHLFMTSMASYASSWKDFHNEWLQFFFELGPVAPFLFLAGVACTLIQASRNPVAFRQVLLYSAYMVANPPLRTAAGAGLGVYIFKKAWAK